MKTKKIVADTIPLALKMVRQQLGDNAIIVNTRAVKSGGLFGFFAKQKYEVTAYAIDKEVPRPQPKPAVERLEKAKQEPTVKSHHKQGNVEERNEPVINLVNEKDSAVPGPNKIETEQTGSGFHNKPQKLYQYYSQSQPPEKEKVTTSSHESDTQLIDEIKNLRKMMMAFMTSEKSGNASSTRLSKWVNRLKKQGVDEEVLEYIVIYTINSMINKFGSLTNANDEAIEKEMITIVQGIIEKRIPKSNVLQDDVRMIKVIGPTGVGKTTTIAKLATEQILKQKRTVALITTDVYRIAAVEQLKTYAGILNVPIEVARSRDELDQALDILQHHNLIYMDTTGRNYKDEKNRESVREFLDHPVKSDNYLALSLTTKYEDLKLLLDEFLDSPVTKLILTKYDETASFGSILNIAYKYPYKIAYITNGQSVPEDITYIDAVKLSTSLVGDDL